MTSTHLGEELFILSIPSSETVNAQLDMKDILHAIGVDQVASLTWGIARLECFGSKEAQAVLGALDAAPGRRLIISGDRFLELAQASSQTLDGVYVGYLSRADANEFLEKGWETIHFATSPAKMVVEVIDGWLFDVYLRSRTDAEHLARHFQGVRWEDPADYLIRPS